MKRYTYPEAAEELRVPEAWLHRNIARLPHTRKGRAVTFSETDLEEIDAMFHHKPDPELTVSLVGSHPLADLKPLPARGTAARLVS